MSHDEETFVDIVVNELPIMLTAADGARCKASWFSVPGALANVVLLPELGVEVRRYHRFARLLASQGFNVLPLDLRGQGEFDRITQKESEGLSYLLEHDWPAAVRTANGLAPGIPLVILGHGLSGLLSCLYAASMSRQVKGIAMLAAGTPYAAALPFPDRIASLAKTHARWLLAEVVERLPWPVSMPPSAVLRDLACWSRSGRFASGSSTQDTFLALRKMNLPVFSLGFEADTVSPPAAIAAWGACLEQCDVVARIRTTAECAPVGAGHLDWLAAPDIVVADLACWLYGLSAVRSRIDVSRRDVCFQV